MEVILSNIHKALNFLNQEAVMLKIQKGGVLSL